MPKPKKHPTVARVREVFDYDPTTGVMTRKVRLGNNGQAGKVVGSDGKQGYLYVSLDHGQYLLHRIAWAHYHGEWPSQVIDHIDGNGYNNAIRNLRDVAHRANSANMLRNKSMRADAAKWRAYQESLTVAEPVKLECPKCGADRSKVPCAGELMNCHFKGVAQPAEPQECGCCGRSDGCDPDCDAVQPTSAEGVSIAAIQDILATLELTPAAREVYDHTWMEFALAILSRYGSKP